MCTTNECDFQCGKKATGRGGGNNWTDLTCLTRAFSASLPAASAMRKSLFAGENATLFIGKTIVRFDSMAKRARNKRRRGGTVSCGGTARGLVARSKNHSRILPLTFLRFAQPPRGRRVCIGYEEKSNLGATARCSRRWRSTDRFCLPTRLLAPIAPLAVLRTEGSFFGVTDSRHIPGSRAESREPGNFPRGVPRDSARAAMRYPPDRKCTDADIRRWDVCVELISD